MFVHTPSEIKKKEQSDCVHPEPKGREGHEQVRKIQKIIHVKTLAKNAKDGKGCEIHNRHKRVQMMRRLWIFPIFPCPNKQLLCPIDYK